MDMYDLTHVPQDKHTLRFTYLETPGCYLFLIFLLSSLSSSTLSLWTLWLLNSLLSTLMSVPSSALSRASFDGFGNLNGEI